MRAAWQLRGTLGILMLAALACASAPPPPPSGPPSGPPSDESFDSLAAPAPVRMMWLPVDTVVHPKLGPAINQHLETARLPGLPAQDRAPVSMETAQLSLECSQPTPECHTAVGRHLQVNRLLWAEIERHRRKGGLIVRLFLFDVDTATMAARAERTFPDQKSALTQMETLLAELTSSNTPSDAPTSQADPAAP